MNTIYVLITLLVSLILLLWILLLQLTVCFHKFLSGQGLMGDAVTCTKCGFSKYPESFILYRLYKLLGRIQKP